MTAGLRPTSPSVTCLLYRPVWSAQAIFFADSLPPHNQRIMLQRARASLTRESFPQAWELNCINQSGVIGVRHCVIWARNLTLCFAVAGAGAVAYPAAPSAPRVAATEPIQESWGQPLTGQDQAQAISELVALRAKWPQNASGTLSGYAKISTSDAAAKTAQSRSYEGKITSRGRSHRNLSVSLARNVMSGLGAIRTVKRRVFAPGKLK